MTTFNKLASAGFFHWWSPNFSIPTQPQVCFGAVNLENLAILQPYRCELATPYATGIQCDEAFRIDQAQRRPVAANDRRIGRAATGCGTTASGGGPTLKELLLAPSPRGELELPARGRLRRRVAGDAG